MKRVMVIFGVLLLVIPSFALPKEEQTISVSGRGSIFVEPDTARVRLGVEVLRNTAVEAQNANAEIMQKVITAIEKQGIAKDKIQTSGFNLWPEMKYEPNQPPKIVGYRCSNQVQITVEDMKKISRIIDSGISAGANQVQGVNFFRRDDTQYKKQALEKAVKEASEKASAIASAANLKLKGIKSIVESGAVSFPPSDAMRVMAAAETPISPGLLEITGSVTMVYQVE